MTLTLKYDEFEHLDISIYNNNQYKHKQFGYVILEVCHEDFDYQSFFLLEDEQRIFLGDSNDSFTDEGFIEIDFKKEYT